MTGEHGHGTGLSGALENVLYTIHNAHSLDGVMDVPGEIHSQSGSKGLITYFLNYIFRVKRDLVNASLSAVLYEGVALSNHHSAQDPISSSG